MNIIEEFIAYLKEQVNNHSIYVWGAQGQAAPTITEAWIKKREKNDEKNYTRAINYWKKQVKAGYGDVLRAFDCSGLMCYFWQNTKHVLSYDHNAHGLMGKCEIVTDRKPGYLLFRLDGNRAVHVGALIDKDTCIHAKGRDVGVVKEPYKASYWHRIGRPKFVDASLFDGVKPSEPNPPAPVVPTPAVPTPADGAFVLTRNLKKGNKGQDVIEVKKLLIAAGYTEGITIDTPTSKNFGRSTEKLVKAFQKSKGLKVDGVVGRETITALGGSYKN